MAKAVRRITTGKTPEELEALRAERTRELSSANLSKRPPLVPISSRIDRSTEFLEYVEPRRDYTDLVLSPALEKSLFEISEEYRSADAIRRHHVPLRNRLLFCGPPGCGKTVTAEVFAKRVGLPMMVAKLDVIFGSLFGETASNLTKVFATVEKQPVVLFLDEFDALARTREDRSEHNEMRRIVNNLLLMIDRYKGRGFIIAATNLEATIDAALFRRFDEVLVFDLPSVASIRRMLRARTKNFPADFDIAGSADALIGKSFADIERICFHATRRAILDHRRKIGEADFQHALESDSQRQAVRSKVLNSFR